MDFGLGTFALGYAAGVLSTLSPCVLPLVPILIVSALAQHRRGPLALAAGLALSFAVVGLLIATVGVALGLDQGLLRQFAALLLVGFGIALLSTKLQERFASLASGVSSAGHGLLARITAGGLWGQFLVGGLLFLPVLFVVGPPGMEVLPLIVASSLVHVVYISALVRAYHHGDFSFAYPLARGGGALLAAIGGVACWLRCRMRLIGQLLGEFVEGSLRRGESLFNRS